MSNILGHFFYKKTNNGNLIGEFSNTSVNRIFTESADLIIDNNYEHNALFVPTNFDFVGTYFSNWREVRVSTPAILTISKRTDTIYLLEWRSNENNNVIYWGEGFLVDNMLIGHYRNFKTV